MNETKPASFPPGPFDLWAPRLLAFLTLAVPLVICLDMVDTFDLPKLTLVYVVDLILAALWIRQSMTQGRLYVRRSALDLPLIAFLASAGVSTILSIDPKLSLLGSYKIYVFGCLPMVAFAALYWFTVQAASEKLSMGVQRAVLYAAVLAAVYAGLQYWGSEIFQRMPKAPGGRVWSSLGNPLYLGALSMMALPVVYVRLNSNDEKTRYSRRYGLWTAVCLTGAGLILSLSRSAWLGAAGAMVCLYVVNLRSSKQRHLILIILALFSIGVLCLPTARRQASRLFSPAEVSNASRIAGWKAGWKIWHAHPWIGSGTDTFFQAFRPYRSLDFVRVTGTGVTQGDAHNDFVQIAATQGTFGLAAFLWLVVCLFRRICKSLFDPSRDGIAAALMALGIQNQFNFSAVATTAWAAVFAGLVVMETEPREWVRTVSPRALWLALALCPVGLWAAFIPVRADIAYQSGQLWLQVNHVPNAVHYLQRAVDLQGRVDIYKSSLANTLRTRATYSPSGPAREMYFDRAWATADSATRDHPHHPDVWNNRGVAAMWMVQLAQRDLSRVARESFERAILLDPVFIDAWANLARWEHLAGHLDKEKELWRKVLEIDPTHAMARQVLELK